jgi:dephospho-CoA kinase
LQITHLQWIYCNISLDIKHHGYLGHKKADDLYKEILELLDLAPDKVSETSRFLLEINFIELTKASLETQHYWTLAVNAVLKAQRLEARRGAHPKQIQKLVNRKMPSRKKLGVVALERKIRANGMHTHSSQGAHKIAEDHTQTTLASFITKHLHPANVNSILRSNKHLKKPD